MAKIPSIDRRNSSVMKPMTSGEIEQILGGVVAEAAAAAPVKVVARSTGLKERHIRALREGEHFPGGAALIALAMQAPELKAVVGRLLGFMPPTVAGADQALAEIKAIAMRYAEEGDREQPE